MKINQATNSETTSVTISKAVTDVPRLPWLARMTRAALITRIGVLRTMLMHSSCQFSIYGDLSQTRTAMQCETVLVNKVKSSFYNDPDCMVFQLVTPQLQRIVVALKSHFLTLCYELVSSIVTGKKSKN